MQSGPYLRHTLAISAKTQGFGAIMAPTQSGMDRTVHESLRATMSVTLLRNGLPLHSGMLKNCGLEISNAEALFK